MPKKKKGGGGNPSLRDAANKVKKRNKKVRDQLKEAGKTKPKKKK